MADSPDDPKARLDAAKARREIQQRDAARGCLLALVLEGAAILGGILWLICAAVGLERLRIAAAVAFFAFTIAAVVLVGLLLLLGNTPRQRRIRREHAELAAGFTTEDTETTERQK